MALTQTDVSAINAGISVIPMIIDFIKSIHTVANPTNPPLTDSQVLAILQELAASTIAKDEAWLAAHPVSQPVSPAPPAPPTA